MARGSGLGLRLILIGRINLLVRGYVLVSRGCNWDNYLYIVSNMDDDNKLVEGEIVDESTDVPATAGAVDHDQAALVLNLENTIKGHLTQIEKLQEDLSQHRDMLKAAFENDAVYNEHAEAAKAANKVKAKTKAEILKKPDVAELASKVKSESSEFKELQAALSDYLGEFNRLSGITELEGPDGELRQIVYVARLVKKTR